MKLNKKRLLLISFIILILLILLLVIKRLENNKDKVQYMNLDFESRIETLNSFDSDKYYKIGWLQVQGTNIDLPILDSRTGNADLKYSFGWRSSTYVTGENREVLLGHNVLNVSSTPMLSNENLKDFESLMSFSYASFAKDNLYIQYTKNSKDELYLIYAIGFYDYGYDDSESINDKDSLKKYISSVRKNSIYDYDVDVNEDDDLITIKVCTRYFGLNEKQQFIIEARKLRNDEELVKYDVDTNENFDALINSSKMN